MPQISTRRAARKALLGLIAIACMFVAAAAVQAAGNSADFSVSVSPASQTVGSSPAATASYTVSIAPLNGYKGTVTLTTSVPQGSSVSWTNAGKTTAGPTTQVSVSSQGASAILTVSGQMAPQTYRLSITGTSGSLSHTATATLGVSTQDFSLSSSSASQTALNQGNTQDSVTYGITVTPSGGFTGPVALSVPSGLPSNVSASFNPASTTSTAPNSTLTLGVGPNVPAGSYPFTIQGVSTINGSSATRTTQATLIVQASRPFAISGNVPNPLYPGAAAQPFTVTLTNPNPFTIKVTSLGSVTATAVNAPGCDSGWFKFVWLNPIAAGTSISIASGGSYREPATAQMVDSGTSQDACQGKQLSLTYSGATYTK